MEVLQQHTQTYTKFGVTFTITIEGGFYIARATKLLKSQRIARIFGYKFRTEEARDKHVSDYITQLEKAAAIKEAKAIALKEAKSFTVNPFKLGDIFVDSWGYDQTNVDFYQVIEIKPKSVVVREICSSQVEGTHGMDCCNVIPVKDAFTRNSEPFNKLVQVYISNGIPQYYIKSSFGWCSLHKEGETHYNSWYA